MEECFVVEFIEEREGVIEVFGCNRQGYTGKGYCMFIGIPKNMLFDGEYEDMQDVQQIFTSSTDGDSKLADIRFRDDLAKDIVKVIIKNYKETGTYKDKIVMLKSR